MGAERDSGIASMLASGTEIAAALGLEERVIAISHECDFPPGLMNRPRLSRPRFEPAGLSSGEIDSAVRNAMIEHGSVYEIDADALEALRPGLILTQAVCEVCAVPTPGIEKIIESRGIGARVLSLDAHTIEEILDSMIAVGRAAGIEARAAEVAGRLRGRIDDVRRAVSQLAVRRVLAVEWLDPPFVPGHWVPEMIGIAGGECLVGRPAAHSDQVEWPALCGLDPDILIVMPCGYGLEASRGDADRFANRLVEVASRAIGEGCAWVVDGSAYFNRSGPRVVDGIEILACILHPAELGEPPSGAAIRWTPPS